MNHGIPAEVKMTLVASLASSLEMVCQLDAETRQVDEHAQWEAAKQQTERALAWVRAQRTDLGTPEVST